MEIYRILQIYSFTQEWEVLEIRYEDIQKSFPQETRRDALNISGKNLLYQKITTPEAYRIDYQLLKWVSV